MGDRPAHPQVWAKVNAPLDEGVRALVEALSGFKGLQTTESCQDINGQACVLFFVGENPCDWRPAATLVLGRIGPSLAKRLGDLAGVPLRTTDIGDTQGELTVRLDALDDTVSLLRELATAC